MFELNDIITTKNWQSLCDHIYDAPNLDNVPEGGSCWCACDQIHEFFKRIDGTGRSYILVSSHSDYGLALQVEYPIINDVITTARKIVRGTKPEVGYRPITIQPSCNLTRCHPSHKYSVRCYSYTNATLPRIPDEVKHWFLVNNMVKDEPRITNIPFGVPEDRVEKFANLPKRDKKGLLYVNFGDYTFERIELKNFYREQSWVTFKENISFDEYLDDISTHHFTLCPNGNGVDCYKTLEVIYAGGIPLVERSVTTEGLKLPFIIAYNMFGIFMKDHLRELVKSDNEIINTIGEYNYCKLSFWQEIIRKTKEAIC